MDIDLKADITTDKALIKSILMNEEIFKAIKDDGFSGSFEPDIENETWVSITVNDKCIGVYNFHGRGVITCEIHAHILPEYRKEFSLESGLKILQWFVKYFKYRKLVAQVPFCHPNVKAFCLANGFKEEGINKGSYLKNGELLDQWYLGITDKEIAEFLK